MHCSYVISGNSPQKFCLFIGTPVDGDAIEEVSSRCNLAPVSEIPCMVHITIFVEKVWLFLSLVDCSLSIGVTFIRLFNRVSKVFIFWNYLGRCLRYWSSVIHSLVAIIYVEQELRAFWFWRVDFQAMGSPERRIRKPYSERNRKFYIGVPPSTALTNWPPQQASHKVVSWWHSEGGCTVALV